MWHIILSGALIAGTIYSCLPMNRNSKLPGGGSDRPAPRWEAVPQSQPPATAPDPVTISNAIGYVIQKGTEGPDLTIAKDAKGWAIQTGEGTIANDRLNRPGLDKNLRVERFALGKDMAMVKVVISPSKRSAEFVNLLETVDNDAQPNLVDTNGTKYPAVGFISRDTSTTKFRFTMDHPITGLKEAPATSRNRPERELTLLFVVNSGVDLKELKIGKIALEDWSAKPKHVDDPPKK